MIRRCNGTKSNGEPCGQWPIKGGMVCRKHGGASPHVARKAAVRAEISRWGLDDTEVDPAQTLLRLLSQSRWRADHYAREMERQVAEHGLMETLVGDTMVIDPQSGAMVKVNEYIRGLARLECEERDRCANFAKLAIAAGLAERMVKMNEALGGMVEQVLMAAFEHLELTPEQRAAAPAAIRAGLDVVA